MASTLSVAPEYLKHGIQVKWFDLDDYRTLSEFKNHIDMWFGKGANLTIGTYESDFGNDLGLPKYGDRVTVDEVWDLHIKLCKIPEESRDVFSTYLAHLGGGEYLEFALAEWESRYCGKYSSIEEYAIQFASQVYSEYFENVPPGFRVEVEESFWLYDHWISDEGHIFRTW